MRWGLIILTLMCIACGGCKSGDSSSSESKSARSITSADLPISNSFVLKGESAGDTILMVVDTGIPAMEGLILNTIERLGFNADDVKYIFITHAHVDHYGSANRLREITGARIIVHEEDADALAQSLSPLGDIAATPHGSLNNLIDDLIELLASVPLEKTEPDIIVQDGDSLEDYGFLAEVVHLPGHTFGSVGLLLEHDEQMIMFAGDLVPNDKYDLPYVQEDYAEDWGMVYQSVEKLKAINPDVIYPGHGAMYSSAELQQVQID